MRSWIHGAGTAFALALLPLAGLTAQTPLGTALPDQPLGSPINGGGAAGEFLSTQLAFERVAQARDATHDSLKARFAELGVDYPAQEIYLRVFKHERAMEVWARDRQDSTFTLVREYPVCALPGQLGPKRRMGDYQVPEGFYYIDQFNPRSNYHLSLRVSYPNVADRMRGEVRALGGDIFVHGGCETEGCVPIENDNIQEVYWLAVQAMDAGQRVIPIHIFPSRMDDASMRWLERTFDPEPALLQFWQNLADGFSYFEETGRVPWITVAQDGQYAVPHLDRLAGSDSAAADVDPAVGPLEAADSTANAGVSGGRDSTATTGQAKGSGGP